MRAESLYEYLGQCYNAGSFDPLLAHLREDATYESFDFLYRIKGAKKVVVTLNSIVAQVTGNNDRYKAHKGFFFRQILFFKRLEPCVIIWCHKERTSRCILHCTFKRGKIRSITGLDPNKHTHTRGAAIKTTNKE